MDDHTAVASNPTLEQFKANYHAFLREFNRGNLGRAFAGLAPDCEFHTVEELVEERVLVGPEQVIRFFEEQPLDLIPNWRIEAVRILQAADGVFVALERGRGSGRGSGVPVTQDFASVLELRDRMVVCVRQYATWEQGLTAAGLDPAIAADARRGERSDD